MPSFVCGGVEALRTEYQIGSDRIEGAEVKTASPDALVAAYIPLVLKVANRYKQYQSGQFDCADFVQVGLMAILEARETFDPAAGKSFVGWASLCIKKRIRLMIGMDPKNGYKLKPDDTLSLDKMISDEDPDGESFLDSIPDPNIEPNDDIMARLERAAAVREAVERLEEEKRLIIQENFFGGKTIEEIAYELGTSFSHVSFVRKRGLKELEQDWKLRQKIEPDLRRGGLASFRNTGSSICEMAVLDYEKLFDRLYGDGAYVASFQPVQNAI